MEKGGSPVGKKYPVEGLTICNAYYSDSTIATFIYKQIN
jgi:hypothetical protein